MSEQDMTEQNVTGQGTAQQNANLQGARGVGQQGDSLQGTAPQSVAGKTIVIKVGSSTLTTPEGKLDKDYISSLAKQCAALYEQGAKPVIVSSAAIAAGIELLGMDKRPTDMASLQAAASVGQNALMAAYAQAFGEYNILTSCVLMTRFTTKHREQYLNARDTLMRLLELGVVPVINENDTISTEQIRFGDNDTLGALVACLVSADMCVIFSDIDGLYTANPATDPTAELISTVERITPQMMASAGGAGSHIGSGGMITKLRAARVLMAAGIETVICHGREPEALERICAGEPLGTRFVSRANLHDITPKKLWIALGDTAKGSVIVDEGAKRALTKGGSSLLAVGITRIEGSFQSGDCITIADEQGTTIGVGKVQATSSEVSLACGKTSKELEANDLLRSLADRPIIHRDELVVFE